jgi:hypothetical protein
VEIFPKLEWTIPEYEERERTRDWFWALGVVVATASVAAIIFKNYFFAALIIISGAVLSLFALRKPEMVHYVLDNDGLKVRSNLYKFETIKAFWVEKQSAPTLFIRSSRAFLPLISINIPADLADPIRNVFLSQEVPEEEMHEHVAERILEIFGL